MARAHALEEAAAAVARVRWRGGGGGGRGARREAVPGAREEGRGHGARGRAVGGWRRGRSRGRWCHRPAPQETVPPGPRSVGGQGSERERDRQGSIVLLLSANPGPCRGAALREGTGRESGAGQPPPLATSAPSSEAGAPSAGGGATASPPPPPTPPSPARSSCPLPAGAVISLLLRLRPPPSRPSRGGSPALVADAMVSGPAE